MLNLRQPSLQPRRGQDTAKRRQLTSYYRSKTPNPVASPFSKKTQKPRRRKLLFGAIDIILAILLLSALIYSLLLKPQPKVVINDSSYHSSATYKSQISSLFGSLKNRNKISFDENSVVQAIQKEFPEVQSARVELPFFSQQPTVWLNISKPAFKLVSNGSYIIDSQGLAVAQASQLPRLNKLVALNDQSGFPAGVGKQILSSQAAGFINTVIAQCGRAKVPIASLSLPPLAQELDLRTTDAPYFVKFYLGGDGLTQTGQFLASRQKFAQTKQPPAEYLDVRVSGKIFYK
jgi:hypothetical protein